MLNVTGVKPFAADFVLGVTGRYSCGGSTQAQLGVFPNSLAASGSFLENVSCDVVDEGINLSVASRQLAWREPVRVDSALLNASNVRVASTSGVLDNGVYQFISVETTAVDSGEFEFAGKYSCTGTGERDLVVNASQVVPLIFGTGVQTGVTASTLGCPATEASYSAIVAPLLPLLGGFEAGRPVNLAVELIVSPTELLDNVGMPVPGSAEEPG
ncbi:MAG: hypothetical protein ACRDZN_07715 [Acidimicrobiales bacterium]